MGLLTRIGTVVAFGAALMLPTSAAARTLTSLSVPVPASSSESHFLGVTCPSDTSCTAVGSFVNASGNRLALIESWDGTQWTVVPAAPTPGLRQVSLDAVTCAGPRFCMAGGSGVRGKLATPIAESWNGSRWRLTAFPATGGRVYGAGIGGLACPSASECFAAGGLSTHSEIERWTGRRWRLSTKLKRGDELDAVSCSSRSFCLAVGQNKFTDPLGYLWNGSRWRSAPAPGPSTAPDEIELSQVSCTSARFCLTEGTSYDGDVSSGDVERWNGRRLSEADWEFPKGAQGTDFNAVSCASDTSCLALGDYGDIDPDTGVAQAWDGSRLTVSFSALPDSEPWTADACRPSFCMLVGPLYGTALAQLDGP
jgi:hypothetical protein